MYSCQNFLTPKLHWALTPFSFRLDTRSFFKEIKGKIARQLSQQLIFNHVEKHPTQTAYNVTLSRSSRWSRRLMYPSATTLIHSDSFKIKLLGQNILFRLTCVVCSLRRVSVPNKPWRPSLKTNAATLFAEEWTLGTKGTPRRVSEKPRNTE